MYNLIVQESYLDTYVLDHVLFLFKSYLDFIALCFWRKNFRLKQEKGQLNIDGSQHYCTPFLTYFFSLWAKELIRPFTEVPLSEASLFRGVYSKFFDLGEWIDVY